MAYGRDLIASDAERVRLGAALDPKKKKKVIDPFGYSGGGDVIDPFPGGSGVPGAVPTGYGQLQGKGQPIPMGLAMSEFISGVAGAKSGEPYKSPYYKSAMFGQGVKNMPGYQEGDVLAYGVPLKDKKKKA